MTFFSLYNSDAEKCRKIIKLDKTTIHGSTLDNLITQNCLGLWQRFLTKTTYLTDVLKATTVLWKKDSLTIETDKFKRKYREILIQDLYK